jgi:chromate transporter
VGVIANLALWFALHLLFTRTSSVLIPGLNLPDPASFDARAATIAVVSAVLIFGRGWGVLPVLAVASGLGLALRFA